MPQLRHRVPQIEGFLPSVDARNTDAAMLLDGRNFYFDSKGPKSGFASRILTPFPIGAPLDTQGIRLEDRTYVFTADSILSWRTNVPVTWELIYPFPTPVPAQSQAPWNAIFMEGVIHFAHPYRGLYSAIFNESTVKLWLNPQTADNIPGLPDGIKCMDIVRGRPILVSDEQIVWGAVGDMTDFTPALGGAGFVNISAYVQGKVLSLTTFQDGFVVWTTGGGILAEFLDNELVWRWTPLESTEQPIGPWATRVLSSGEAIFLGRHGLMKAGAGKSPEAWTPEFNEYFISYMKDTADQKRKWRLDYDENREIVYVSESVDNETYWRTFVLTPTRNKWGIFSEKHYGLLPLSDEVFGFIGADKIPRWFSDGFTNEDTPPVGLNYHRSMPRVQKYGRVMSSSAVCNAVLVNQTIPSDDYFIPKAAWYIGVSQTPAAPGVKGLDSWVEIGYTRPAELSGSADGEIEVQEISIGGQLTRPPLEYKDSFETAHVPGFYPDLEDWSSVGVVTNHDYTEDFLVSTLPDEDLLLAPSNQHRDLNALNYPTVVFEDGGVEDWNTEDGTEDWGGKYINASQLGYTPTLQGSLDGFTFDEYVPVLARFDMGNRLFAVISRANVHRLRLDAMNPFDYYHVVALEFTLDYAGEVI